MLFRLQKLMRFGLHGKILCAIRSVLKNNLQSLLNRTYLSNGVEGPMALKKMRVAQGDKLSLLLFSLFTADIKYFLQDIDCNVIFYGDDRTIESTSPDALQKAMNDLAEHCNNNGLTVNIVNTKLMKIRRGGRLAKHDHFHYLGKEFEIVNKFCYLGAAYPHNYWLNHMWKTCTRRPWPQWPQSTQS